MPEQNSIVENWISENESKLKQISVENKPLYESVFLALEYLNNSLGGKVITAPIIEPVVIPEPEKIVYLTNGVRKDVIQIGSVGMILSESENLYRIAWFKDEYEQYDGEYDKTMFTDVNPEFNIGDKVEFPTTQFGSELGEGLENIIQQTKDNNVNWLWIADLQFNAFNDKKWVYWLTHDNVNKYGVYIDDLKISNARTYYEPTPTKVKNLKTSKPRSKYKKGQEVISKTDPTSIYEIIDLKPTLFSKTKYDYRLSSKTDATKSIYWTTEIDLEKDYNISQKKSISLPINEQTLTQKAEFEDLADELDNLEI